MTKQAFRKEFNLYLKDSNAYGNIYFAKHFEWQGVLRESWFSEKVFPNMLNLEGAFVTKDAYTQYLSPSYPFQTIYGLLTVTEMKRASFKLIMEFRDCQTNNLISKGYQTVVFTKKTGKITKLPEEIKSRMLDYVEPSPQHHKDVLTAL